MRRTLLLLSLVLTGMAGAAPSLRIDVQPLYEGQEISFGYMPLRVEVANDGPPARGVIVVDGQDQQTAYPVDLPTGARKRIPVYVNLNWSGTNVVLQTNQGRVVKEFQPIGGGEQGVQQLLMITQSPGELAAVRTLGKNKTTNSLLRDSYVRPDEAPDRPLAYQGIAAVLLGEGSERLTDDTVTALKNYVLMGGTVVMFGGASAPVLSDARWSELSPVENGRVETVGEAEIANTDLEGPLSLVKATARPGTLVRDTYRGTPTLVERPMGLGRVLFMAVNPTETKATGAEVAGMLMRSLRLTDGVRARQLLAAYGGETQTASTSPMGIPVSVAKDPFTAELPKFDTIAWILGGFFLAVIPVNFLLLRASKKGEWAWFTAPVLSLGFAAVLFSKATDLYSAKTSTATTGVIVAQEGVSEGWFVGNTSFFIPAGGNYDLKLKDIDSLGSTAILNEDPFAYRGPSEQPKFDSVDDGRTIAVPELRANNLAFRSLSYRQELPEAGRWFSITTKSVGEETVDWEVRNNSPYTLKNATVMLGSNGKEIGELKPGATKKGGGNFVKDPETGNPGQTASSLDSVSWQSRRPVLTGLVIGMRPGPQIGAEIAGRTSIRLIQMGEKR
ncbi:hypothetical protein BH11ARM2_BH11ARM2_08840 [soil metagenome]